MNTITIGNLTLPQTAALEPLAGAGDAAFRAICRRFGAAVVTTEMVSAKGLCYNNEGSERLIRLTNDERPVGVQLFGNEPYSMAKATEKVIRNKPDFIDINAGCPVPKVVREGAGSALLKDLPLLSAVVKAVVSASDVPVTVKIRSGWSDDTSVETARVVEQAGASAVTVHARTREQFYSGRADRDVIKRVKQAVKIPVVGNGDVATLDDVLRMYEQTGCDLVGIGRGVLGNPQLFAEVNAYFNNQTYTPPTLDEKLEIIRNHIELIITNKGELTAMKEARAHIGWYLRGMRGAAKLRAVACKLSKQSELEAFLSLVKAEQNVE
ncbi:MAG: tRNA dihydrouridine synthase DusB [Oscillospiraceae bacterium]|jgi:nifR3 family TIM-barrel protein|nr:tRNA dihydrouridine synthase DusB [Oscillospiraceae bacterium]